MVVTQAFNGAGDTWTPTWLNFLIFWVWEIPLAYALAIPLHFGPSGVFIAVSVAFSTLALARGASLSPGTLEAGPACDAQAHPAGHSPQPVRRSPQTGGASSRPRRPYGAAEHEPYQTFALGVEVMRPQSLLVGTAIAAVCALAACSSSTSPSGSAGGVGGNSNTITGSSTTTGGAYGTGDVISGAPTPTPSPRAASSRSQ